MIERAKGIERIRAKWRAGLANNGHSVKMMVFNNSAMIDRKPLLSSSKASMSWVSFSVTSP